MKKYFRMLMIAAIPAATLLLLGMSNQSGSTHAGGPLNLNPAPDSLRPDPVCHMKVDDSKADTVHYKGHIFGFCSKGCKESFLKDPDSYLPRKN